MLERFLRKQEAKKAEDIKGLRLPSYRDTDTWEITAKKLRMVDRRNNVDWLLVMDVDAKLVPVDTQIWDRWRSGIVKLIDICISFFIGSTKGHDEAVEQIIERLGWDNVTGVDVWTHLHNHYGISGL